MLIWLSLVSLFLSTFLHYSIQKVFIYYKKFDDFNHRSSHNTLATRTGGIGIFISLLFISLFFYLQGIEIFDYSLFIPLSIMFLVGVYDDFYKADFKLKFFLQIIVSKILIDQGFVISNFYGLMGLGEVPWIFAQLTTVFVFLVIVNAINFIDGIDGLAITEVIKSILLIEFFSYQFTSQILLGTILISSLLPLYYFNFKKKQKIFLGDGGSMLLGTIIMIYILQVLNQNFQLKENFNLNKVLLCVLVVIYPLLDLLRVFVLRILKGKSPFVADQNHIHHYLFKKFQNMKVINLLILFFSLIIFIIFYYALK